MGHGRRSLRLVGGYKVKRVTVFAGHYGSGKTNLAVNFALYLAREKKAVSLADLDIVNPYFRSKDSRRILEEAGVRFISSEYANSNVDVPALPAEAYSITEDESRFGVLDVGGDDRGALALGRYVPALTCENNYDMWFVVNPYRPLTRTPEAALGVLYEIEEACRLPFTGIVSNPNIGEETTAEAVLSAGDYMKKLSRLSSLPVVMTAAHEPLCPLLEGKIEKLFPIKLYVRQSWQKE